MNARELIPQVPGVLAVQRGGCATEQPLDTSHGAGVGPSGQDADGGGELGVRCADDAGHVERAAPRVPPVGQHASRRSAWIASASPWTLRVRISLARRRRTQSRGSAPRPSAMSSSARSRVTATAADRETSRHACTSVPASSAGRRPGAPATVARAPTAKRAPSVAAWRPSQRTRCSARASGWSAPSSSWAAASCTRAGQRRGAPAAVRPTHRSWQDREVAADLVVLREALVLCGELAPRIRVVAGRDSGANAAQRPGASARARSRSAGARLSVGPDGRGRGCAHGWRHA